MDFLSVGATIVGGHFLSELLKGVGEKSKPEPHPGQVGTFPPGTIQVMSQEEELAELIPREPRQLMGPLALDEHLDVDDEAEFWRAYSDTQPGADVAQMEYAGRLLSGFEGEIPPCPIAYGVLMHRALEIRRVHEILHAQRQQAEHAAKLEAAAREKERAPTPPAGGASPAGRLEEEGEIEVKMEEEETPPPKPKRKPKKRVVVKTAEPSSANGATMPAPPVVGSEPHVNGHAKHIEA